MSKAVDQYPSDAISVDVHQEGTSFEYEYAPPLKTSVPNHWANLNNDPGLGNGRPITLNMPTAAPAPFVLPSNRSATYPTVNSFTFWSSSNMILFVSGHPSSTAPFGGKLIPFPRLMGSPSIPRQIPNSTRIFRVNSKSPRIRVNIRQSPVYFERIHGAEIIVFV